ncbi:MAG: pseudaminic acid synthase [Alphaproteobacteria bacterium]|nr:pseudaminic acid synthase [Alphaproteobacteria bacterium]
MSGNHNGDINRALELIRVAKKSGAHAVKLQTYTADTMTIDHDGEGFRIEGGVWDGRSLYELYQEAHTPWSWHEELFALGRQIGIDVFSTPFDESAVDFLEKFDPPAYKLASFEVIDTPLLEKIGATGRPVILSTGMATFAEIEQAASALQVSGAEAIVVLHCVSGYPTTVADSNIRTIPDLADRLNLPVGLSDHTLGTAVAVGAVALGACVIEKHFTLRREDGGPDAAFSLEPAELAELVQNTADVYTALGTAGYDMKASERALAQYRRSIYVVADIAAGETLTEKNIRRIRPGLGLAPQHYRSVLGKNAKRKLARGKPLRLEDIE